MLLPESSTALRAVFTWEKIASVENLARKHCCFGLLRSAQGATGATALGADTASFPRWRAGHESRIEASRGRRVDSGAPNPCELLGSTARSAVGPWGIACLCATGNRHTDNVAESESSTRAGKTNGSFESNRVRRPVFETRGVCVPLGNRHRDSVNLRFTPRAHGAECIYTVG